MAALLRRKSFMIVALALTLAIALITLALDENTRARLGEAYWTIGLAICGSILLVLAGYVWDQTLLTRIKAIHDATQQKLATVAPDDTTRPEPRTSDPDEIIGLARQIERMAQSLQLVEASYRGVVEDQVDLICRYRADGRLTFVNQAMARFLGRSRQELVGQPAPFFPFGFPTRNAQGVLPDASTFEVELRGAGASNALFLWTHRAVTAPTAGLLEYQAVGHDITLRKQAELALAQAKDAAESADRVKSEFLAAASDELGAPARALLGAAAALRQTPVTPEQERHLEEIERSGRRLDTMITDVLQLSRLEAGLVQLVHEPFSLCACLEEAVARARQAAPGRGVTLTVAIAPSVPTVVNGDANHLQAILDHLLHQALQRTPTGEISVSATGISGDEIPGTDCRGLRLFVAITDNGRGMNEQDLAQLFVPFSPRSTRRHNDPARLGLVVAKRLAEIMGGAMSAESRVGEGSTFRFSVTLDYHRSETRSPFGPEAEVHFVRDPKLV